jgi:hypothetical protein
LEKLKQSKVKIVDITDEDGRSPLAFATNPDVAKVLVDAGFPIDPTYFQKFPATVVSYLVTTVSETNKWIENAAIGGDLESVKILAEIPDVDTNVALYQAARYGHFEICKYLVQVKGSSAAVTHMGIERRTALHEACRNGYIDIVRLLVNHGGADVNARDKENWTPLHEAYLCFSLHSTSEEMIDFLVNTCHADTLARNSLGEIPRQCKRESLQQQFRKKIRRV